MTAFLIPMSSSGIFDTSGSLCCCRSTYRNIHRLFLLKFSQVSIKFCCGLWKVAGQSYVSSDI